MRKISDLLISPFLFQGKGWGWVLLSILFFFISCTSCTTTPSTKTDADGVADRDIVIDIDNEIQDTDHDSDTEALEVPDSDHDSPLSDLDSQPSTDRDSDLSTFPDTDHDVDTDIYEEPDYDYLIGTEGDKDCPSLYTAPFPYIGNDGRKHFCRKCDLPAPKNDPHCIRNLWEMNNRAIMKEWPQYYCYPLPCDMSDKAQALDASEYDGEATVDVTSIYNNSTGIFRQADIWEGKIGMYVSAGKRLAAVDDKYLVIGSLLYDIEAKQYSLVSFSTAKQAYNYNRFLFITGNTYDLQSYIISAKKVADGWKYEFVYTDEWNRIKFLYPPAIGENFVLINVENIDGKSEQEILYANVNDWNFKKLGVGTIVYPQIFDDKVIFVQNSMVWSCDLTKNPSNITTDCRKVNQEGIKATAPVVNKHNHNQIIYTSGEGYNQLYMADMTTNTTVYTKLELEKSPDLIKFIPSQWDGDILVLEELYQYSSVDIDYRICYYSVNKDKKVCFPNPNEYGHTMGYIYGGVEGKYIFWQPTARVILKDMEEYCKEVPELCLYDEYMPDEDKPD